MDENDRYLGTLVVHVLGVTNLLKVTKFGVMDPFVVIGLNGEKQRTREITDGGETCTFDEKLRFNIDCMKQDLIHIKVKHKTTFSNTTIGVFSLKMVDFVKHQRKRLKFQLVDEETFEPRGQIEMIPEYIGTNAPPMPEAKSTNASAAPTPVTSPMPVQRAIEPPRSEQPMSPMTPPPSAHPVIVAPPSPQPQPQVLSPAVQQPIVSPTPQVAPPAIYTGVPVVQPGQGYIPPPMSIAAPVITGGPYGSVPVMQQPQHQPYLSAPTGYHPPQQVPYGSQQHAPPAYQPPVMGQMHPQQQPYPASAPPMQHQPYPASAPPMQQQQPVGTHTTVMNGLNQLGSMMTKLAVGVQQGVQQQLQPQLAPFQTLAVGRPHADSRLFDDMQYLGAQRIPAARIVEVRVFAGHTISAIQLVYSVSGQRLDGPIAGATTYAPQVMFLAPDERIEHILGRVSINALESITLKTNKQALRFGPENDGQEFQLNIPQGHRVIGFHGSFAPKGITSFGAYTVPTP